MLTSSILLVATVAASAPEAPYPRPGQPGYTIAKAFAAIVRRDEEVNVQDLSYAFGLPKLLDQDFTWQGPFGAYAEPRFSAYYNPINSPLGITKIVIFWDDGGIVHIDGKSGYSLRLTLFLRPEMCPTVAEMIAATGVPMGSAMSAGVDGGPSYRTQWFTMPDGAGKTRTIQYSPARCELSASYMR